MLAIMQLLHNFVNRSRDERGEVSLEYVLVGGIAAAAIVAGMALFDTSVQAWFTSIQQMISNSLL